MLLLVVLLQPNKSFFTLPPPTGVAVSPPEPVAYQEGDEEDVEDVQVRNNKGLRFQGLRLQGCF